VNIYTFPSNFYQRIVSIFCVLSAICKLSDNFQNAHKYWAEGTGKF